MIVGAKVGNNVGDIAACILKSTGRNICCLHACRGLQDDDGIPADRTGGKDGGSRQDDHDKERGQ